MRISADRAEEVSQYLHVEKKARRERVVLSSKSEISFCEKPFTPE